MKIVAISDTHKQHRAITTPKCDLLIHAGDIGWEGWGRGGAECYKDFFNWMSEQPATHKVFIAGNHDWIAFYQHSMVKQKARENGIHYLCDDMIEISAGGKLNDVLKIYGSPYSLEFCGWAFSIPRQEEEMRRRWNKIPDDVDILITHGPPQNILDSIVEVIDGEEFIIDDRLGDPILKERIEEVRPKVHIAGHIHSGNGIVDIDGIKYVNASICNEKYEPINPISVIEI